MTARGLFVGDVSWDTTVVAPELPEPDEKIVVDACLDAVGGVAANAAAACALAGADVLLCSSVGDDTAGAAVKADLARIGLPAQLETTLGPTARAVIILDAAGEKRLFLYQGDRMYPSADGLATISLDGVRWVHTALYDRAAAATLLRRCRADGIPWSIDLEPATIPVDLSDLAEHLIGCAVAIINSRAAAMLGADPVGLLRSLGVHTVIETLGGRGVRVHEQGADAVAVIPAPLAGPVRDTTGAGDAFAGWLVAGLLRGSSLLASAEEAVRAATLSVQSVGTIASYPTRADLIDSLQPSPERSTQ